MCETCGCDGEHEHEHEHEHNHSHSHAHERPAVVSIEQAVLSKNDARASRNRAWLAGREILALNLLSSPGSGKTTLLERTIRSLKDKHALYVIEGDQETAIDAKRIEAAGAPAVQINTANGCHLDAGMTARAFMELKPATGAIVLIENVGNLICPALFDLGERAKIVILSVTEGDDKPIKYPHVFRAAQMLIINKIDLLPYVQFDVGRCVAHARSVNPAIQVLRLSAATGEGCRGWFDWIGAQRQAAQQEALSHGLIG